jgi:hypothetical protein
MFASIDDEVPDDINHPDENDGDAPPSESDYSMNFSGVDESMMSDVSTLIFSSPSTQFVATHP